MTAQTHNVARLLMRVEEAADALGISRTALYGLLRAGEIPVLRIGRSVRVPVAALEHYVATHSQSDTTGTDGSIISQL